MIKNIKIGQCVIFALFFSALVGYGSSCSSKRPEPEPEIESWDPHPMISGGIPVDPHDRIPYQLSIRYNLFGTWIHLCGAVILDEITAITAAHCLDNSENLSRYLVVAGETYWSVAEGHEQVLHLQKIIIHPKYTGVSGGSDIAILKVDKFQLGPNQHAQPVLLRPVAKETLSGRKAVVSGWGETSNVPPSNVVQKGYVSILSEKDCLNRLENRTKVPVPEGIVCAHDPVGRICTGDSGGPLVIPNYTMGNSTGNLLVGITSFGPIKCSRQKSAGVFTEINYFYDWIQANRDQPIQ